MINNLALRFFRANILVLIAAFILSSALPAYFFVSAHAAITSKAWDGGGSTNNWSEAANWSGDSVPGAGDDVIFDATSTKNATIDVNINVGSIAITSGYTGSITQSNAASIIISGCNGRPCYKQDNGTFNGSTNTITLNNIGFGALTLNGGTFTGGSGDITMNGAGADLSLQGGTFTSTSGNLSFTGTPRFQGTSVFNHNNGTVILTSTQNQFFVGDSNHTSVHFNNLIFNAGNGVDYGLGLRVIVEGSLNMNDGSVGSNGATIEARGSVSISPNFDGGVASLELANGTGPRTMTLGTNLNLPKFVINDANVTVNTSGTGALTFPHQLILSAGIFNQANDLVINAAGIGGGFCFIQNGGIFNGSSNSITINSNGFGAIRMNGGSFNGGSGDILLAGASNQSPELSMQGGVFRSTSGTLTTAGTIRTQGTSTFLHNNGTVTLTADNSLQALVGDSNHQSITLNNLNFNLADGAAFLIGSRPIVLGNLALNDGSIGQNGATIEVRGTYTLAQTFDGGNVSLEFGPAGLPRTLTLTAGLTYPRVVLNDPNLTVNTSGSGTLVLPHQLVIKNGIFNQGNVDLSITPLDIGGGACLAMTGGTFNGSDHLLTLTANGFGAIFMTGGTFNGDTGNIVATGPAANIAVNGASFTSTSGTLFAGRDFRIQSKSVFDPNGGTVVFDEGADGPIVSIVADDIQGRFLDITFNNVVVNKLASTVLLGVINMNVNGTLTFTDGSIDAVSASTIKAFSDVDFASTFDGLTNHVTLEYSGSACQTVTLAGTQNFPGLWRVDKSACGITANGNFGVGSIAVPNGSFVFGSSSHGNVTNNMTVDPDGRVSLDNNAAVNVTGNVNLNGGSLDVAGSSTSVSVGGVIDASGNGGDLTIDAGSVGAAIDVSGTGGDLTIDVEGTGSAIDVSSTGGDLTITVNGSDNVFNAGNGQIGGMLNVSGSDNTVQFDSLTIQPSGRLIADAPATIIVGGDIVNNGLVNLHAGSVCAPSNGPFLTIQSTAPGTQRNWSGTGLFRLINVNVRDMTGSSSIKVHGGANLGNNGSNWTFDGSCRANALHAHSDFDGDSGTDISIFRPTEGNWYTLSSRIGVLVQNWGAGTDIVTPGDYDGDGITDLAVFRPSDGDWWVLRSSDSTVDRFNWGTIGDVAVAADYDGDGKTDKAVFRPSDGNWYVMGTRNGAEVVNWGIAGDVTVPGDYDGDGKTDVAVFRPSEGNWYIAGTTSGVQSVHWGIAGDIPAAADYDGDGKDDIALFRPSDGNWYIVGTTSGVQVVNWGTTGDIPVAGDYDADGKTDVAVFRPSEGNWYIIGSTSGVQVVNWGIAGDVPIPAKY